MKKIIIQELLKIAAIRTPLAIEHFKSKTETLAPEDLSLRRKKILSHLQNKDFGCAKQSVIGLVSLLDDFDYSPFIKNNGYISVPVGAILKIINHDHSKEAVGVVPAGDSDFNHYLKQFNGDNWDIEHDEVIEPIAPERLEVILSRQDTGKLFEITNKLSSHFEKFNITNPGVLKTSVSS